MAASSSTRLLATKFPIGLHRSPTTKSQLTPLKPRNNLSFFHRSITFQKIPTLTKLSSLSSSSSSNSVDLQPIEELPPKLREIVNLFQSVQDSKSKYEQLLFYGKNLKPLDTQFKTAENKVQGCVSQVWVRAYLDDEQNVVFEADSDSVLTKGLAALLVLGLSGRPALEILRVSPDFAVLLGLQQSLTPSRNNGFLNMLRLMQKKALMLLVKADSNSGATELSSQDEPFGSDETVGNIILDNVEVLDEKESNSDGLGSRGMRIRERLEKELNPVELEVEDVSYQHAGHAGVVGSGNGETHFNVRVVSEEFEGKSSVKRHRLIYTLLQEELQTGLHALSIVAKAPFER